MDKLHWTKGLFRNRLTVRRGNEQVGVIDWNNFFSSDALATINGHRFLLNRDFFLSKLEISDATTQALLATIMINLFNPKGDLVLNGKRFELEIKNFWQSRWSWKYNGQEIIVFQSQEFLTKDSGTIEIYTADTEELEVLILLGLFVRNQLVLFMVFLLFVVLFMLM